MQIKNLQEKASGIKKAVLEDFLNEADTPQDFFNHVISQSFQINDGTITRFGYTCDAEAFFDKHYQEINNLRNEYEDETGEAIDLGTNLKETLAHFSYMLVFSQVAEELGLDY